MGNDADLISVVIPLFNGARWIGETLASIEAQSHGRIEIIVVDDGSTDAGPEIIAAHSGRVRLVRQENAGEAAARNRGLAEARGEFVTFVDQDDLWHPRHLELLRAELQASRCDAIAPRSASFMSRSTLREMPKENPDCLLDGEEPALNELLTRVDSPTDGSSVPVTFQNVIQRNYSNTVLATRVFLISVGGFPTACPGWGDYLLMVNCSRQGVLRYMQEPTVFYRLHPTMSTWGYDMALRGLSVRVMLRGGCREWSTQTTWDAYTIAKLFDRPTVPVLRSVADAMSFAHLLGAPKMKTARIVLGKYGRRGLLRITGRSGANRGLPTP